MNKLAKVTTLVESLLSESDNQVLVSLLSHVKEKVWLVGSRSHGTPRPDSDIDLHIIDMMETDATYDAVTNFLTDNKVEFGGDKWGTGSIYVPVQSGVPVEVEFGFWHGVPNDPELGQVNVFGVNLTAPSVTHSMDSASEHTL